MGHSSPPPSPFDTNIKSRKSWFGLSLRHSKVSQKTRQSTHLNDTEASLDNNNARDPYRPIQFSPNRLATLYVTPSERNLYLAAMAQLDQNPPPLPLWSDPAPVLPKVEHQAPLDPPSTTSFPPLSAVPLSPKLVTSPDLDRSSGGLHVRDEFRTIPTRSAKHAFLALTGSSGLRFTGFPVRVLKDVDEVIGSNWSLRVVSRSESIEMLQIRDASETVEGWRVDLGGAVWKRKGSQELGTIRLLLAILSCLGTHGYTIIDAIQAASMKNDLHNLLFTHSSETRSHPPLFFAVSFPLVDRISIISPPPKSTPAIISAIRQAIISTHSHQNGLSSDIGNQIKLEGWVHRGVYRFWIGGMRRWLGTGVKRKVADSIHANLLLAIINSLSSLHFTLTASIPLIPSTTGRDVLFFASLPSSGLSVRDTYVTLPDIDPSTDSGSPVIVSRNDVPPQPVSILRIGNRGAKREERPVPWTAALGETPPGTPRQREASEQSNSSQAPPSATPQTLRSASRESQVPLVKGRGGSTESSPRQRNVLLKKTSLRRKTSLNRSGQAGDYELGQPIGGRLLPRVDDYPQRTNEATPRGDDEPSEGDASMRQHYLGMPNSYSHRSLHESDPTDHMDRERWSFVDDPSSTRQAPQVDDQGLTVPNPDPPRPSTGDSGDTGSLYFDPSADSHAPNSIPNETVPLRETTEISPLREVTSPRQANLVSVGSGLGVPSMRGSVGFLGGQSVVSGYAPTVPEKDGPLGGVPEKDQPASSVPAPSGQGSARTKVNYNYA